MHRFQLAPHVLIMIIQLLSPDGSLRTSLPPLAILPLLVLSLHPLVVLQLLPCCFPLLGFLQLQLLPLVVVLLLAFTFPATPSEHRGLLPPLPPPVNEAEGR
jgi:hypothetical protein